LLCATVCGTRFGRSVSEGLNNAIKRARVCVDWTARIKVYIIAVNSFSFQPCNLSINLSRYWITMWVVRRYCEWRDVSVTVCESVREQKYDAML